MAVAQEEFQGRPGGVTLGMSPWHLMCTAGLHSPEDKGAPLADAGFREWHRVGIQAPTQVLTMLSHTQRPAGTQRV